jgi:hypothetical protein
MKEIKLKPLAKITEVQRRNLGSINAQINTLGSALERVFLRKQEFLEDVRKAYGLDTRDFYVTAQTGEVFELWPKA